MKASAYIAQSLYAKQLATLTQLYLELRLPLSHALRAAEADLGQPKDLDLVIDAIQLPGNVGALDDEHSNRDGAIVA